MTLVYGWPVWTHSAGGLDSLAYDLLDRADRLLGSAGRHPDWPGYAQSVTSQAADIVREVLVALEEAFYGSAI